MDEEVDEYEADKQEDDVIKTLDDAGIDPDDVEFKIRRAGEALERWAKQWDIIKDSHHRAFRTGRPAIFYIAAEEALMSGEGYRKEAEAWRAIVYMDLQSLRERIRVLEKQIKK